jgi:hypothetical protein
MKKINKSLPLIFITLIFVSFSLCAQNNADRWEKIKNQYGKEGLRYIASDVEIAELIDLKDPVFMSTPLKANVLLNSKKNTFEHIFILFTRNDMNDNVKSLKGYSINYIKVYTDSKEIYFKNGLSVVDNYIVLNGNLPDTKKIMNEIFNGSDKVKEMFFYVVVNTPNSSKLILTFGIKSY